MPERRHYPPAKIIHVPHCIEGAELPSVPIGSVPGFVSYRFHFCFGAVAHKSVAEISVIGIYPMVTVETIDYGPHTYLPGDEEPEDAVDRLCRVCRGTHGTEADQVTANGLPQIVKTQTGLYRA
ncbi:hypothetical protein [Actinoplanes subglobosus]|uniref:Uncharacterized protein n=1 Tax=Actinoplanes subglobosus TaxID=1547892 RepID=A0ABV8J060_9ACTN